MEEAGLRIEGLGPALQAGEVLTLLGEDGPRLLLGRQGATELAGADQRVAPGALAALGHRFRQAGVEDVLAHQLGHDAAPGVLNR